MRLFFLLFFMSSAQALTDKSKIIRPPVVEKIESTKEKSQLKVIETGSPIVLHHREPMLLPDGKVIEVDYFSHKHSLPGGPRRASVGLKISGDTSELIVLHQEIDKENHEKLSSEEGTNYIFKLERILYDDQITVTVTPK